MKRLALLACSFAVAFLFSGSVVSAQSVNDFVITSFVSDYELNNDDPQGTLVTTETINVDFSAQNRGILRALPNDYKGNSLELDIQSVERDGNTEPYITYQDSGNTVLQIGDPNVFITGEHQYVISYSMENVITFYDDYDEFFWDVNGTQWLQSFDVVTAELDIPTQRPSDLKPQCFTGSEGSTQSDCTVQEASSSVNYQTTRALNAGETLTILHAFEKGYFTPESWFEKYYGFIVASPIFLAQIAVLFGAYRKWKTYGKDRVRKTTAPYFSRPKYVSLALAGTLYNNRLNSKFITGNILDLAIRGYVVIEETGEGKKAKHALILKSNDFSRLQKEEKDLLEAIFADKKPGDKVQIDKSTKLYKTTEKLNKELMAQLSAEDYYDISPKQQFSKMRTQFLLALVLLVFGSLAGALTFGVSVITGFVTLFAVVIFMSLMTRRSQKGAKLVEHIKGLRLYLNTAEKERLKMQDAVAAPLSKNAHQPTRNREFYEKLLPYAVALGVEKTWSKSFADIYQQPPEWYSGNMNTFSTLALANSLSSMSRATSQSFTPPSSSGSSGYSGGGSAGGGGGGGGGGGW